MDAASLFAELKRRRVFRVLVGYGIVSFAVLQIIEPIMHALHLPDATLTYVVLALAVGFPVAVVLAWAFDVNEGRIERTAPAASPKLTGTRLLLLLVGIGLVAAAPGVIWYFAFRGHAKSAAEPPSMVVPSIAVLPFADMSAGKDQEYFSDGIAEEILDNLAQVEGLRVIGRTSSFSFKGKNDDLRVIGEKLGVANVLEGSVRKEGGRVRITAQLIEAAGGSHLWSKTFDREMTGIFAVQGEIAKAVVEALQLHLLPKQVSIRGQRTDKPEAHDEYLIGRQFYFRGGIEDLRRAVAAFKKAVAADPGYALAWAWLAHATFNLGNSMYVVGNYSTEINDPAFAAAEKAVLLGPDLSDAYAARGRLRAQIKWDWSGALSDLERALALDPANDTALRVSSAVLPSLGRVTEAIAQGLKATQIDPLATNSWVVLGDAMMDGGQLGPARVAYERALKISPDHELARGVLAFLDLMEGHPESAIARLDSLPAGSIEHLEVTAMAQHDLAHAGESRRALDLLLAKYARTSPSSIAEVYAWRGEKDLAFEWLERAYVLRDGGLGAMKVDPLLRNLRGDPRYSALLKKMNLPLD